MFHHYLLNTKDCIKRRLGSPDINYIYFLNMPISSAGYYLGYLI